MEHNLTMANLKLKPFLFTPRPNKGPIGEKNKSYIRKKEKYNPNVTRGFTPPNRAPVVPCALRMFKYHHFMTKLLISSSQMRFFFIEFMLPGTR